MSIQSIQLVSNNIRYGPMPEPTDEVEQHLTISSSGQVWFSARNYEQYHEGKGFCRKKQLNIGKWKAEFLLFLCEGISEKPYATDCGSYDLEIRYEGGSKRGIYGSLIEDMEVPLYGGMTKLTKLIRRYIPIYGLWVFNGSLSPDYEGKKAIHLFTKEWLHKFENEKKEQLEYDFGNSFGDGCIKLGFQMDTGNEFNRRYPSCFNSNSTELEKVTTSIEDVDLLGSAVFSKWRYMTHWAYMFTIDENDRNWFRLILKQMMELTKRKDTSF